MSQRARGETGFRPFLVRRLEVSSWGVASLPFFCFLFFNFISLYFFLCREAHNATGLRRKDRFMEARPARPAGRGPSLTPPEITALSIFNLLHGE